MDINEDKTAALLNINGTYTARQIESLISDLALVRGQLDPPVPFTPPLGPKIEGNISVQSNPSVAIRRMRNGDGRLYIRNHGLGWLVFDFVKVKLGDFRDAMVSKTLDIDPAGNLVQVKRGDRDRSH